MSAWLNVWSKSQVVGWNPSASVMKNVEDLHGQYIHVTTFIVYQISNEIAKTSMCISSGFVSEDVSMSVSSFDGRTEYCQSKRYVNYSTNVDSF